MLYWPYVAFMLAAHGLAAVAVWYAATVHFSWATVALAVLWYLACGLAIAAGYHRLFSHATYRCHAALRVIYLLFGAACGQNSALKWASDHRRHHAFVDQEADPININKGFWWAHIGWILRKDPPADLSNVRDLQADPLVRFQHRYYLPLAFAVGAGLPAAIGSLWSDAIGALLWAGFLRTVLLWHATFLINSLAHTVGSQPHGSSVTARDNLFMALIAFGEGYHNYHHLFPSDYRVGVRWHHFDPAKWWIWLSAKAGLAGQLKRGGEIMIFAEPHRTSS